MPMPPSAAETVSLPLSVFVARADAERMAFPVVVMPPQAQQRFGGPTDDIWTVKSEAQNRWLDRRVTYDPITGAEKSRSGFADQHVLDQIVNTGVAWHEGQLFGLANQLIGLATATALITLSIVGILMWLNAGHEANWALRNQRRHSKRGGQWQCSSCLPSSFHYLERRCWLF